MAKFTVTHNNLSHVFDTAGTLDAGGTWTVNAQGALVVQPPAAAAPIIIPVEWKFDSNNQLCIHSGTKLLINFHVGSRPRMRLSKNLLQVRPNENLSFEFVVPFAWSLDANYDLKATLGGLTSVISGYTSDKKSRLIYWFYDKKALGHPPFSLEFTGEWARDAAVEDKIKLVFKFLSNGVEAQFEFPTAFLVDKASNNLVLSYSKSSVIRRLELRGAVSIGPNFDVVFSIAQQTNSAGGVVTKETTISVAANFEFKSLSGAFELTVGRVQSPTAQKIVIGGTFRANFANNGSLSINFAYARELNAGQTSIVTIATQATFAWVNGTVTLTYTRNGTVTILAGQTNFMLGAVSVHSGINVATDQGARSVTVFLGLSW